MNAHAELVFERLPGFAELAKGLETKLDERLMEPVARFDAGYICRRYSDCIVVYRPDGGATKLEMDPGCVLGPVALAQGGIIVERGNGWDLVNLRSGRVKSRLVIPLQRKPIVVNQSKPWARLAGNDHLLFFADTPAFWSKNVMHLPFVRDKESGTRSLTLVSVNIKTKQASPLIRIAIPQIDGDVAFQDFESDFVVFRERTIAFTFGDDVIVCRLDRSLDHLEALHEASKRAAKGNGNIIDFQDFRISANKVTGSIR